MAAVAVVAAVVVAAVAAAAIDTVTEAPKLCAQTAPSWSSMRRPTVSRSQQNKDKIPTWYKPPKSD
jgi:hypothetical protein